MLSACIFFSTAFVALPSLLLRFGRTLRVPTCSRYISPRVRPINRSPYMPPRKGIIDKVVVEINSSSDDEAEICARTSNFNGYLSASSRPTAVNGISASHEGAGAVSSTYQTAEFKSFWKAGNCDVSPVAKFNSSPGGSSRPFRSFIVLFHVYSVLFFSFSFIRIS